MNESSPEGKIDALKTAWLQFVSTLMLGVICVLEIIIIWLLWVPPRVVREELRQHDSEKTQQIEAIGNKLDLLLTGKDNKP